MKFKKKHNPKVKKMNIFICMPHQIAYKIQIGMKWLKYKVLHEMRNGDQCKKNGD